LQRNSHSVPEGCLPVIEIDANRNATVEADTDLRFYFDEQDSMHVEHVKELARYVGGLQYNEIGANTSTSDSIKNVFYDNLPVSNIAAFGYKTGSNTYTVAVPSLSISNDNKGCNYLISYTYKNNYPNSWVVAKRYERTFYPLQANFNGFGSCYTHNFNE
jgi:dihydroorotase